MKIGEGQLGALVIHRNDTISADRRRTLLRSRQGPSFTALFLSLSGLGLSRGGKSAAPRERSPRRQTSGEPTVRPAHRATTASNLGGGDRDGRIDSERAGSAQAGISAMGHFLPSQSLERSARLGVIADLHQSRDKRPGRADSGLSRSHSRMGRFDRPLGGIPGPCLWMFGPARERTFVPGFGTCQLPAHASSPSSAFASFRSFVSKPSVNQP
jgi:hypothetical protein